jgi:hypothetical protein
MKYLTPYGSGHNRNFDSLAYQTHLDSPKAYPNGARFATHIDHTAMGPVHWNYTWQTLSQSGTTTRMMAVEGSELWYTNTLGKPTHHTCESGQIVLIAPGSGSNTWTISVPRTSTTPATPNPRRKHTLRQEHDHVPDGDHDQLDSADEEE